MEVPLWKSHLMSDIAVPALIQPHASRGFNPTMGAGLSRRGDDHGDRHPLDIRDPAMIPAQGS